MAKNKIIIIAAIIIAITAVVVFECFIKDKNHIQDKNQESARQAAGDIPRFKFSGDSRQTGGSSGQTDTIQEEVNEVNSIINSLNGLNNSAQNLGEDTDLEEAYSNE